MTSTERVHNRANPPQSTSSVTLTFWLPDNVSDSFFLLLRVCFHKCHHPQCMSIMQLPQSSLEQRYKKGWWLKGAQKLHHCSCHYNIAQQMSFIHPESFIPIQHTKSWCVLSNHLKNGCLSDKVICFTCYGLNCSLSQHSIQMKPYVGNLG